MDKRTSIGNLKFPIDFFTKNHKLIKIVGFFEDFKRKELKVEHAYIFNDKVFVYYKKAPEQVSDVPVIVLTKDDEIVTLNDINGEGIEVDEVLNSKFASICNATDEDMDFTKNVETAPQASSTAIYVPVINESDDFLKKLIKSVFLIKQVPTTRYRKKITKAYQFSNIFQALNNITKTSTTMWQTWMELLGMDYIVILKDARLEADEPTIDRYLVYKSRNDTITAVEPDNIRDHLSDIL